MQIVCTQIFSHLFANSGSKWYIQQLDRYLENKYPLTRADRVHLAKNVLALLLANPDPGLQGRWCNTVSRLLKKTLANSIPALDTELDIVIEWRPLYELVKKVCFPAPALVPATNPATKSYFAKAIARLIAKARHYFPDEATAEILAEFLPSLCPFDEHFYRSQCFLNLLLPTKNPDLVKVYPMIIETSKCQLFYVPIFLILTNRGGCQKCSKRSRW